MKPWKQNVLIALAILCAATLFLPALSWLAWLAAQLMAPVPR
jgi:hypothetical protein